MTLTRDILEAATPQLSGALEKEWVDINALLSSCINLLRFKANEKKQTITLTIPDTPLSLYINKEKIWRVINNLVINAIKFSNSGSVIEVTTARDKYQLRIAVKDSGIGIPDNMKNKVFDMFTDAKRYGTAGEKSFGLGLSICQQIIEDHDGTISFESEENKGTTFVVSLPIDGIRIR
jgi:two-component system, OmpR family, sensor histidine kinase VicK